ncbi:uncharacterized protein LOC129910068 isoform X2 [Episyrphus balteatus]|uniref:uncharacterized protein LOC129910068 isoform X2 n=1 Tax=Episyrphus balteatus TaxID=286459 RepID=UPI0024856394|nr:uncharacterized protein LOC129910068 isoform X2 [Episyrphus balteatus]
MEQNGDQVAAQHPGTPRPVKAAQAAVATPNSTPVKVLKPILKKDPKPVVVAAVVPEQKPVIVADIILEPPKEEKMDLANAVSTESIDGSEENGGSPRKPFFKKIFGGIRKKPSVRAKERKIRQNRHLRKVILPKNALMALYEIKGIQIGDFIINSNMEGGFTALVTVNDCQYEGVGNSKGNAKTNACEKALRDFVIKKMMQKPREKSISEPMDLGESSEATNGDEGNLSAEETDDVPMVNLASFALYKLFTAWENEGFHVPEFHPAPPQHSSQQNPETAAAKKPVGRNELPPNWEIMHPATLLCIMRPRLTYTDCGNNGDAANPAQTVKVIVDDREFVGVGRSKKIARKNVAIAVCNSLFGTNFQVPTEEE